MKVYIHDEPAGWRLAITGAVGLGHLGELDVYWRSVTRGRLKKPVILDLRKAESVDSDATAWLLQRHREGAVLQTCSQTNLGLPGELMGKAEPAPCPEPTWWDRLRAVVAHASRV